MKINGSLVFDASSASEIQNLRVQKVSSLPTYGSADAGRMVYVTGTSTLYYGSQGLSNWVAIATGGNAAALQTEVDAIETSLGAIVDGSGTFQVGAVTGPAFSGTEADLTQLLQALSNYANANNQLSELDDVSLTAAAANDFLMYNGTAWTDHVLVAADLTDVTATAAELNILDGATLTVTELNYVDGVTSSIQDQLDNKQALDAGLTSLAALTGTGIIVQTADNVFTARSLVEPAAGITITDPAGIAGNPTFALANDLAALEGLATTGYIVRTGDGTATTRSLAVNSGELVITGDAAGVSTDTTFGLATVSNSGTGTFLKFARDGFGRVTGTTAVVTSDITALADSQYLRLDGTTVMTGNINAGGFNITSMAGPVADTDAANKAYVDAVAQGLSWKQAVRAATTGNITLSGTQTIDGVVLVAGDRVLVKDQTTAADNGIYVVAAGAWTRASDMNAPGEFDSSAMFVQEGTVNEGTGWTETLTVVTVGTSPVAFSQFSGGQAFIWGTGLGNTGNTIFVNLGSGIVEKPSDSIGIDLYDEANSALILTVNGTDRESPTSDNGQLYLLLDAAGALQQTSAGLKIAANSVTNAMIVNDTMVVNGDTGTGSLALGGTLEVKGDSVKGIVTSVNGTGTFTVTASDASASQKGVASFDSNDFTVTAGNVVIAAGGVDNAQLANSTITITGTTGSDAVALGETLTFSSTVSGLVSSTVATNGVALDVRKATASLTGVASFAAADFTVDGAGEVTVVAKGLDALTDVTLTSPTQGDILVRDGAGQFVNKKAYYLHDQTASSTTWNVSHNLGQKYCSVTVVDSGDEVVIPQSITFDSTTGLTVTFNTAITGKVVVMGIA